MSSQSKSSQKNLECPICKDIFNKPVKMSLCGHSFCEKCLRHYIAQTKSNNSSPSCPVCRKDIPQSIEDIPRSFTIEGMVDTYYDELQASHSAGSNVTEADVPIIKVKIEHSMKSEKFDEALEDLEQLMPHLKGEEKFSAMINVLACQVKTTQLEKVSATTRKLKEFAKDLFESINEEPNQPYLGEYDGRIKKLSDELEKMEDNDMESIQQLIYCRVYMAKQESKHNKRLRMLGGFGKTLVAYAELMKEGKKENFKGLFYPIMDYILFEMYKINPGNRKVKVKQVGWYLVHCGLCCKAIEDFFKAIKYNDKAMHFMEFEFGDDAANQKLYGHCHCNNGSAYELADQLLKRRGSTYKLVDYLQEAKFSYENAVKAYKTVPLNSESGGWNNLKEKEDTISNAEKYFSRVCQKLQ